jgi:CRP-like cAMP-binding protein
MEPTPLFDRPDDTVRFEPGATIFRKGDPPDVMYVVLEGTVAIGTDETVLDRIEAGGLFGEMALIDDAPRSADARAETHVALSPVDKERFHELVARTPHFAVQVMSVMAQRLRRLMR